MSNGRWKNLPGYFMIEGLLRELTEETRCAETRELAGMLCERVMALEGQEVWVQAARSYLELEAWRLLVRQMLKTDEGVVRVSQSGETLALPTRFGTLVQGENGKRWWQQQLWGEMTWDEFQRNILRLQAQAGVLQDRVTALREILKLRDRFPGTQTPMEACALAGINPRDFALDQPAL